MQENFLYYLLPFKFKKGVKQLIDLFEKKDGKLEKIDLDKLEPGKQSRIWLDLEETGKDEVKRILELFKIHPLTIEDAQNNNARVKLENFTDYPDCTNYLFIVFRKISFDKGLKLAQVALIITANEIITISPKKVDTLQKLKDNLQLVEKKLTKGPDYLAHLIIDMLVDENYQILDKVYERLDKLEERIFKQNSPDLLNELFSQKRDVLTLRKVIQPERDAVMSLSHAPNTFISKGAALYFRDVHDHLFHNIERLDTFRELISSALEVHLSMTSNRMNDIMKVLTIIATIMLPLTLITGIYGMNFNTNASVLNMPELNWAYGYPFAILLMVFVALAFIIFFKRKGWI